MRILHVNKFLYRRGGAEAYLLDIAALQRAADHEVALFGMEHPENPTLPYAEHFPRYIEFEPPPRGVPAKLRAAGRMLYSVSARRGMDTVLDIFRPDIVHLHNIYHQLSPSVLSPVRSSGIPAVMTLHDYKLTCPTYRLLDKGALCTACVDGGFIQAAKRRCKDGSFTASALAGFEVAVHHELGAYAPIGRFLCPSAFLAGIMQRGGVYPERMHVLPNFVDARDVPVKLSPGGPLVFAGRLSWEKGVDTLIEAVAMLGRAARLEVAGDGPERSRLEDLAARRAPGRVRFHGRLPRKGVLSLLNAGVASVLPSRWYENQPIAVLESFAAGVPVVATDLGGFPELVTPGVTGALAPHDDPAALAQTLSGVLDDPDAALAMGRAARRLVEERHGPERHLHDLHEHYAAVSAPVEVGP